MTRLRTVKLAFLFLMVAFASSGQQKYWIANHDTGEMPGVLPEPSFCSKWLRACSYRLTKAQVSILDQAGIHYEEVCQFSYHDSSPPGKMGFALEQVEAQSFVRAGLDGTGVKIGIIDGGFLKAQEAKSLAHFFRDQKVRYHKDYITPDLSPYSGSSILGDDHGTHVWELIGGMDAEKNIQFGLATQSTYYLARTDHGGFEKRVEEDKLIEALEDMHRLGVRLVNISLGYNIGFNDQQENYLPEHMDGKTSAVARAIDVAVLEKGMLIVVAAGNEGRAKWKIVSTPGDAQNALTVASSKLKVWDKMDYSSIGPDFIQYTKPDVAVYATGGTSFSTPVITGMAACIWQADSTLTNLEVMDIIKRSGHFHPYANNYLGHGVPTCTRILSILKGEELQYAPLIKCKKPYYTVKKVGSAKYVVAFHKKDERIVKSRVVYRPGRKPVKVRRIEGVAQTSILIGNEVVEVLWE